MTPLDKKLYKLFSDKTLSKGCMIHWIEYKHWELSENFEYVKFYKETDSWLSQSSYCIDTNWKEYCIYTILWHPPQLHDVFRVAMDREIRGMLVQNISTLIFFSGEWEDEVHNKVPYNPTLPLLSQTDETKSAIISLFS